MSAFGAPQQQPSWSEMTPEQQAQAGALAMTKVMHSCPGKSVFAGVTGFGFGGIFGLFMASMSYDTNIGSGMTTQIADLPFKQQMKLQFSDMGKRAWSSAKNFGFIGLVFTGTECAIESLRAKHDIWNGVVGGCLTGGGLAVKSGPQSALFGCAAFAAFSTAIELYLSSDSAPPPSTDEDE
ncbi:mitochondrial import inner membrane translocase subunit Tim22p [Trichomonascus vanleenenianus]|uniref:translocation channel protein TIM22 n=1 Tax=Trichomonascus vanleenenianus TaxID=2268995 RepID=UPI003ECB28E9